MPDLEITERNDLRKLRNGGSNTEFHKERMAPLLCIEEGKDMFARHEALLDVP